MIKGRWKKDGLFFTLQEVSLAPGDLAKGDFEGHPFRGNQWTEDGAGPSGEIKHHVVKYSQTLYGGREISEASKNIINGMEPKNTESSETARALLQAIQSSKTDVALFRSVYFSNDPLQLSSESQKYQVELDNTKVGDVINLDRISSFSSDRREAAYYGVSGKGYSNYEFEINGQTHAISTDEFTGMDHKEYLTFGKYKVVNIKSPSKVKVPEGYKGTVHYNKTFVLEELNSDLAKGDFEGHPFRGNQWTGGQAPIPYLGDANDDRRIPTVADSPLQHIVQEQLKTLPENHMDGISDITFTEDSFVGGEAYGDYHPLTKRIRLASNADNIAVLGGGTAIHEVGHHVHISRMTDEGAEEWQRISGNGQNARISAYARTNRGEHFAEAYREYMRGGDHRKKLKALEPASYKYMASVSRGKWLLPEGESAPTGNWRSRYED